MKNIQGKNDFDKQVEVYRFKAYDKKRYSYLFCLNNSGKYELIQCLEWGVISNGWIANDNPIHFIANQCHAFNSKTTTGVKEIKRVCWKDLPKKVKKLYLQK